MQLKRAWEGAQRRRVENRTLERISKKIESTPFIMATVLVVALYALLSLNNIGNISYADIICRRESLSIEPNAASSNAALVSDASCAFGWGITRHPDLPWFG